MVPEDIKQEQNIFDESLPQIEVSPAKKKLMVKKKKKKVYEPQMGIYANNEDWRERYSQIQTNNLKETVGLKSGVYLDGRTFEQIVMSSKKPKRMPPPLPVQKPNLFETGYEDKEDGEAQLVFHLKRSHPINMANKKKKQLFIREQLLGYDDKIDDADDQLLFNTGNQDRKKVKKAEQVSKIRPKSHTLEDKMINFLKQKYREEEGQEEEEAGEQLKQKAL